jgi:hypothetical protein
MKIDVKGAIMQTPMLGEPTYVELDPKITRYAMDLYPELEKMVESNGCLYTILLKVFYGCMHANALWYVLVRKVLKDLGYEVGPIGPCMLMKKVGNRIFVLLLYMDDILTIVDEKEVKRLKEWLVARFRSIQFEANERLSYLGMDMDITDEGTQVDMSFYVK